MPKFKSAGGQILPVDGREREREGERGREREREGDRERKGERCRIWLFN
jgi:hypothetical protein